MDKIVKEPQIVVTVIVDGMVEKNNENVNFDNHEEEVILENEDDIEVYEIVDVLKDLNFVVFFNGNLKNLKSIKV